MDYKINLASLQSKQHEFELLESKVLRLVDEFNTQFNGQKLSDINKLETNLSEYMERLKNGYQKCNIWLDDYLKKISSMEEKLSNQESERIEKPQEFREEFIDLFGAKVITTLKATGDKDANLELGILSNLYGDAVAKKAIDLACSAIGTNYLTAEDAASVGCTLSGDGRLHVPDIPYSSRYRAELPQTQNILKFWDEEHERAIGGMAWYGPVSCSPWIGSVLRYMGYDQTIGTQAAIDEGLISPWTGEKITNAISAHGEGTYMYNHPESFDCIDVDPNKSIAEQCEPGDILACPSHIIIYTGNEIAQERFPGTTGDTVEAAENGRCYPGVTNAGSGKVGSYKVFRVKNPATTID